MSSPRNSPTPPTSTPSSATTPTGLPVWLVLACLVLLAFNLRPAATSVGPVLEEVRAGLSLSPTTTSILTSLPVFAFAVVGGLAPWIARVVGLHRVSLFALVAVVIGLGARATTDSGTLFLLWTALAVSGMACANVLAPSLVKLHFPDRIGFATSCYTTAMATGLTLAFTATVPVAEAAGTWRWGLGAWALVAAVAVVPWIALVVRDRKPAAAERTITFGQVARTPLGWALAGFFGVQSAIAYSMFGWFAQMWRDTGYSATYAGVLVGLIAAAGIPCSLVLPTLLARVKDQRVLMMGVIACYPIAFAGLLALPGQYGVLWALLLGVGGTTFPLILVLVSMRARTAPGTAALSGFTQSVGYLIATPGPLVLGLIHNHAGGWVAPIWFLLGLLVPLVALALYVGRPAYLEDQVRTR
ncbi:MFS transporter [Nocardioides yefusunii]|uniref:MFS transporter n=1 Tax=Nocardioides yefusunii TaxID=2500546 RepID=A0ABW1QYV4_9ACTN|nr:MFS transporter [Nocardioides yefusunii]